MRGDEGSRVTASDYCHSQARIRCIRSSGNRGTLHLIIAEVPAGGLDPWPRTTTIAAFSLISPAYGY